MSESSEELKRIANAIEEILRLVKLDQERSRKYMEKDSE
jgi:predicted ribonuclease toxin of YeeF-YezG toxin-antitoxin module